MKIGENFFHRKSIVIITVCVLTFISYNTGFAQDKEYYVRIVNLVVDSTQLKGFKAALKKDIEEAIQTEPGVLTLHAVYDKDNPTHVTVFEIYVNEEAHKAHTQTAHFIRYKNTTKDMVKSTIRTEVIPIAIAAKRAL